MSDFNISSLSSDMRVSIFQSLRVRILAIVICFLVTVLTMFTVNTLHEFEKASKASIEHEGMLLSNLLEATIGPLALENDIAGIQSYIDRVVSLRTKNDIEINLLFSVGTKSEIVASNDRGNIEGTDDEEHDAMIEALKLRRPVLIVDTTSDDIDADDNPASRSDPAHIDFYIQPNFRFMSIMTPLIVKDKELGAINVQLSLGFLDVIMHSLYMRVFITLCVGLCVLATGISIYLSITLFRPLWNLAQNIYHFGIGKLSDVNFVSNRQDEIGIINTEFSHMVTRVRKAEADSLTYMKEIEHQKDEVEKLLLNILPQRIIDRLHTGETMIADAHQSATVLFADLVGFTKYAANHSPDQVVKVLNEVFFRFDNIALEHGVEKIKTIGDSYMGVAGVPLTCEDHSIRASRAAIDMMHAIDDMNREGICDFRLRIGLHTGPAVAGVIGKHKFSYDVWGDTVNIAKRYESASVPGRIHLSKAVADNISSTLAIESRGLVTIKDVGDVESFFLNNV